MSHLKSTKFAENLDVGVVNLDFENACLHELNLKMREKKNVDFQIMETFHGKAFQMFSI